MAESINNRYQLFSANTDPVGIKFLQGTQISLNTLMTNQDAIEGAFYLTSDTQRLYVGRKLLNDSSKIIPVPVNEGVTTVASADDLPNTANVGDFYYAEAENILCVCSSAEGSGASRTCTWVQLNSNTTVRSLTHTLTASGTNGVQIGTTLTDSRNQSVNANWKLIGSDNITVTYSNDSKTITLTTTDTRYSLGVSSENGDTDHYITLGDGTTTQKIKVEGTRINVDTATAGILKLEGEHIKGATETHDSGTGWRIGVKVGATTSSQGTDATTKATIDPIIHYGTGASASAGTEAKFTLGTAVLDVYTTGQADSMMDSKILAAKQAFNAMEFKGVISQASDIPSLATCSSGWTYKLGANNLSIPGIIGAKTGDLIVAYGTEDANGQLTNADAEWQLVPSGDEPVYTGELLEHGFRLMAGTSVEAGFQLLAGNMISLVDSATGKLRKVTVNHAGVTKVDTIDSTGTVQGSTFATSTATNSLEFYVLDASSTSTGIIRDDYGHITEVKTKKITVKDTHNYITVHSTSASVSNNVASVKHYLGNKDTSIGSPESEMKFSSGTLTFTASTTGTARTAGAIGTVNIDLNWGTF